MIDEILFDPNVPCEYVRNESIGQRKDPATAKFPCRQGRGAVARTEGQVDATSRNAMNVTGRRDPYISSRGNFLDPVKESTFPSLQEPPDG